MDTYKKFIKEEYEWVFGNDSDSINYILEGFEGKITAEEFEKYQDVILNTSVNNFYNDEYVVQQIHENMDDTIREVIRDFIEDKEGFIEDNKIKPENNTKELMKEYICDAIDADALEEFVIDDGKMAYFIYNEYDPDAGKHVMKKRENVDKEEIKIKYTRHIENNNDCSAPAWIKDIVR